MLRRPFTALALCVMALALPVASSAQQAYFGPQIGVFMPQDKVLRDALGDSWFSFGASRIRIWELNQAKWAHDWNAIGQSRDGNTVFILTGSFGLVTPFAPPGSDMMPYAAVRVGLAYMDYAVTTPSGRESSKRLGANANAALGFNFGERFNVEVRYDLWNEFDGLSFNGLTIAAKYGLLKF